MTAPEEHAHRGIAATVTATDALINAVDKLDDMAVRGPSGLPAWTRAHVITHLARNADALLNLLIWARTGVEHPMYTSRADRNASIEEGSTRGYLLLVEDLAAACDRFARAAETMPDSAWSTGVVAARGLPIKAARVPWLRMREVWIHLVDLDAGVGFDAVPDEVVDILLDDVVQQFDGRTDVPALTIDAMLPAGRRRSWYLGATSPDDGSPGHGDGRDGGSDDGGGSGPSVGGTGVDLLGWLTGRSDGRGLTGELPVLPRWA